MGGVDLGKEQELTSLLGEESGDDDIETQMNDVDSQRRRLEQRIEKRLLKQYYRFVILGLVSAVMLGFIIGLSFRNIYDSSKTESKTISTGGGDSINKAQEQQQLPVKLFFDEYPVSTTTIEIRGEDEVGENGYKLPTGMARLTDLAILKLDYNALGGPLPTFIGALTNLEHLDLRGNEFEGSIPSEFSKLTKLTFLDLSHNKFLDGTLSSKLLMSLQTNLEVLDLSGNYFEGSVPSEIGLLTQLTMLGLQANDFSNDLPTEIGHLTKLQSLWLQYNPLLTGTIPTTLCDHIPSHALLLSHTNITGCIPPS